MKINKMPGALYVQWYLDPDAETPGGTYLQCSENAESASEQDCGAFDPGKQVGIYILDRVVSLKRTVTVKEAAAG